MLDFDTRGAVLKLKQKGHGIRKIARILKVHRQTVKRVLVQGKQVPEIERPEKLIEHLMRIQELNKECCGNLIRVHEELAERDKIDVPYSTLTAFCRKHGIGAKKKKKVASGSYDFGPGEEMQHDTSPHDVKVGERKLRLQCASLVLAFSRVIFFQVYLTWNRFFCKVFLTEAAKFNGGMAGRCVVDNASIIVVRGTGKNAVMAQEMVALANRFGFDFMAHELGDADRSAFVENPFNLIENNFYPGRTFKDIKDLNLQAREYCRKREKLFKRTIQAAPIELFQRERFELKPLPEYIPEVYEPHKRIVDDYGYVHLHTNRYSVDENLVGLWLTVRETKDQVSIFKGHKLLEVHEREDDRSNRRCTLPQHKRRGRHKKKNGHYPPSPEEQTLRHACPELSAMVDALKKNHGRAVRKLRKLHKMYIEYELDPLRRAVSTALEHGLLDLNRIERMVLRNIGTHFFKQPK